MLANGTPVPYDTCLSITDWTHPTFEEMIGPPGSYARVRLVAGRNALAAGYYALFLSRFFYNTFPTAKRQHRAINTAVRPGHVGPGRQPGER